MAGDGAGMRHGIGGRRLSWSVVGVVAAVVYLASPPAYSGADSMLTFPTAVSIVHDGDLALDEYASTKLPRHYSWWQTDSGAFTGFPWTPALVLVPVVLVVDAVAVVTGGPTSVERILDAESTLSTTVNRYEHIGASLLTAGCVVLLGLLIEQRLTRRGSPRPTRSAVIASLALAFGSNAWAVLSKANWQHGPSIVLVTITLLLVDRLDDSSRVVRRPMWTATTIGVALGLAETIRPTNAVVLLACTGWFWLRQRRLLPSYLVGLGTALGIWASVNVLSFSRVVPPYFSAGRLRWHDDFLNALAANLVSPSRGLFVMSPILLLAPLGVWLASRRRDYDGVQLLCAVAAVGIYVGTSAYPHWWGGDAFGQRLLTETYPYLAVLSVPVIDGLASWRSPSPRRTVAVSAVCALMVLSAVIQWQGAFLRASLCWSRLPHNVARHDPRFWSWSDSQSFRGLRVMIEERSYDAAAHQACPPGRR